MGNLFHYFLRSGAPLFYCSLVVTMLAAAIIRSRLTGNTPVCHFASVSFVSIGHWRDLDTFY